MVLYVAFRFYFKFSILYTLLILLAQTLPQHETIYTDSNVCVLYGYVLFYYTIHILSLLR